MRNVEKAVPAHWNVGDQLRVYRARKRLSQGKVGKLLGVSATIVSQIERGLTPSDDLRRKLEYLFKEE